MFYRTIPAGLLLAATLPNLSAAAGWTGFYAGVQFGATSTDASVPGRSFSEDSTTYGLLAGYNHDIGNQLVLGGELNIDKMEYSDVSWDLTTQRIRARLGYDLGDVLIFGSIGYARVDDEGNDGENGYSLGLGLDYKITQSLTLGLELLRDSYDFDAPAGLGDADLDIDSLRLRLAYRF